MHVCTFRLNSENSYALRALRLASFMYKLAHVLMDIPLLKGLQRRKFLGRHRSAAS